jgi:hypothetical protein
MEIIWPADPSAIPRCKIGIQGNQSNFIDQIHSCEKKYR